MTVLDLAARGFVKSRLPPFFGFCGTCGAYCTIEWWVARACVSWRRRETTACQRQGHVDIRDDAWIARDYPESKARVA